MRCEICGVNEATGFLQLYDSKTGEINEDAIGPNVCDPCADSMCDDEDTLSIDDLDKE